MHFSWILMIKEVVFIFLKFLPIIKFCFAISFFFFLICQAQWPASKIKFYSFTFKTQSLWKRNNHLRRACRPFNLSSKTKQGRLTGGFSVALRLSYKSQDVDPGDGDTTSVSNDKCIVINVSYGQTCKKGN